MSHPILYRIFQQLWQRLKQIFHSQPKQPKQKKTGFSVDTLESKVEFGSFEDRIFYKDGEKIYLGRKLMPQVMRETLRDEAKYFANSNLLEVLNATVINEAFSLSMQASNHDHTEYAKALYYWNTIIQKTISALSK